MCGNIFRRNCIVCKDLLIKVSDQAMYCSKYDSEYYINDSYVKIPLRWMAWEAVLSVIVYLVIKISKKKRISTFFQ